MHMAVEIDIGLDSNMDLDLELQLTFGLVSDINIILDLVLHLDSY